MIKVIIKKPFKPAEVTEIDGQLKTMQKIVGGHIEAIPYPKPKGMQNIIVWCNEEGKLMQLMPNIFFPEINDVLVGTIFITGTEDDGGNLIGLNDEQIEFLLPDLEGRVQLLTHRFIAAISIKEKK